MPRKDPTRAPKLILQTVVGLLLPVAMVVVVANGCACPGHFGTKTTDIQSLANNPGISVAYRGSDAEFHHFVRDNCYSLFAPGRWAVTDAFRVPRSQFSVRDELPVSNESALWRRYTIDSLNQLIDDFPER